MKKDIYMLAQGLAEPPVWTRQFPAAESLKYSHRGLSKTTHLTKNHLKCEISRENQYSQLLQSREKL